MKKQINVDSDFIEKANQNNESIIFEWINTYEEIIREIQDYYSDKLIFDRIASDVYMKWLSKNNDPFEIKRERILKGTAKVPLDLLEDLKGLPFEKLNNPKLLRFFFNIRSDIAFCEYLIEKYPGIDFLKVSEFFKINQEMNIKVGKKEYFGIFIVIITVVMQFTPNNVIMSFGVDYDLFSKIVFYISLSVFSLLGLLVVTEWLIFYRKINKQKKFIAKLLQWAKILS